MDMVLAKSDLALASRYAELVPDRRLRERVHASIAGEWQRTVQALGMITGQKQRLANNAALQRSPFMPFAPAVRAEDLDEAVHLAAPAREAARFMTVTAAAPPALQRSIRHRFPYLDPLHHLQVELIRRHRSGVRDKDRDDRVRRGIHLSINGIAAGLRNTG